MKSVPITPTWLCSWDSIYVLSNCEEWSTYVTEQRPNWVCTNTFTTIWLVNIKKPSQLCGGRVWFLRQSSLLPFQLFLRNFQMLQISSFCLRELICCALNWNSGHLVIQQGSFILKEICNKLSSSSIKLYWCWSCVSFSSLNGFPIGACNLYLNA